VRDTLKFGKLGGVAVGVNWSLFALGAMVAYLLSTSRLPADVPGYTQSAYWVAGAMTAVALLVGVLVHEFAHAVAAKRADMKVDGITLWFMGGLTRIEGDSRSPGSELWIALVGPLASAALGGASIGLAVLARAAGWGLAGGALDWLGAINLLLGVFNLVPAAPLDGGRVLHGILWAATRNRWLATRLSAGAGTVLGMACVFAGLTLFEARDAVDGVIFAIMGWFVLSSAKREQVAGRAQHVLGDARVSDIMRPAVIAPGWLTVSAFWNEWVNPYPEAAFLLERWGGGDPAGVVTAQQLAAVPPGMQGTVRAQDIALALPPASASAARTPLGPAPPCRYSTMAPRWASCWHPTSWPWCPRGPRCRGGHGAPCGRRRRRPPAGLERRTSAIPARTRARSRRRGARRRRRTGVDGTLGRLSTLTWG
jgi:Zn-dependent protease